MNPISKFGFTLLSATALAIMILKLLTHFELFESSSFYSDLQAVALLFGVFVGIGIIMILSPIMKNYWILIFVFLGTVIFVYLIVAPVYIGGLK